MAYVDGFVIPIPKKKLANYRRVALKAGKIWKEYGALDVHECAGDDLKNQFGVQFLKAARARPGETVMFSWIIYKSRAQRDSVNRRIMKDPRIAAMMDPKDAPFDPKRMVYGGFKVIVDV